MVTTTRSDSPSFFSVIQGRNSMYESGLTGKNARGYSRFIWGRRQQCTMMYVKNVASGSRFQYSAVESPVSGSSPPFPVHPTLSIHILRLAPIHHSFRAVRMTDPPDQPQKADSLSQNMSINSKITSSYRKHSCAPVQYTLSRSGARRH